MSTSGSENTLDETKIPKSHFTSRIQPPSTLPLRTTSRIRQTTATRRSLTGQTKDEQSRSTTSKIPPPRVSFLTPREVWSPLATPIPNMSTQQVPHHIANSGPRVPKYQLKDTGPIPLSTSTSMPKPQIRPRSVYRPSIKAHRQPSIQRPAIQIPRPHIRPMTSTQQSSRLPLPSHSRPVSLPADPSPLMTIPKPRPASHQPVPTASSSSSYITQATIAIPEPRPSFLPVPRAPSIPTSVEPFRHPSNHSTASSTCSSASSLARHRAIKKKGQDRPSSARLSQVYSPPDHNALIKALGIDSEGELEGLEGEDTESTISDHSIRTVATVNPPLPLPDRQETGYSYEGGLKSQHPSISSTHSAIPREEPGLTAPYLVPSSAPPMTLEWESDESSGEIDEAEKVWRELELKLGRKVRGRSLRRGKWVVKPRNEGDRTPCQHSSKDEQPHSPNLDVGDGNIGEATAMENTSSGFSVSLYYSSPAHSQSTLPSQVTYTRPASFTYGSSPITESPSSATALFDMSAPLVPGGSKNGNTPWNTPLMNKESIKRGNRVKKRYASMDVGDLGGHQDRLGSLEEYTRLEFPQVDDYLPRSDTGSQYDGEGRSDYLSTPEDVDNTPEPISLEQSASSQIETKPESPHSSTTSRPQRSSKPMYRLDSHIVSALTALQGTFDSPDLDFALRSSSSSTPILSPMLASPATHDEVEAEGGLGLGMKMNLKTVYHLPTLSPRLRPSAAGIRSVDVEVHDKDQAHLESPTGEATPSSNVIKNADNDESSRDTPNIEFTQMVGEDDEEVLVIRDLDTGLERQVRVGDGLTLT
ncbi:hypothetical protein I302_106378 [Kwoniella bestiolae CBS 10118]|uniref:Uncharacterized protein n=1 Tax=Kwoniella bestiolae CBS 10118 TaxID=1296100 RepID=A0A1B9G3P3_9TREE|nr:hypothetical protein I302_05501 [Kwoniella bestiolae CBS 10118]OCF25677.1 hypothetical protein I302_05501 [Kwoniella bestiolae CBS 10118]